MKYAGFGNLTFQNVCFVCLHLALHPAGDRVGDRTNHTVTDLTVNVVHPACHLHPHGRAGRQTESKKKTLFPLTLHLHGRAGRQGRNISLPPCRLHPLDRAMPFAVRLLWQGGTLRASSYRGAASPACLRYCRRWGNVSLGHPLAHHSEGRQSRLKKRQGFHR